MGLSHALYHVSQILKRKPKLIIFVHRNSEMKISVNILPQSLFSAIHCRLLEPSLRPLDILELLDAPDGPSCIPLFLNDLSCRDELH